MRFSLLGISFLVSCGAEGNKSSGEVPSPTSDANNNSTSKDAGVKDTAEPEEPAVNSSGTIEQCYERKSMEEEANRNLNAWMCLTNENPDYFLTQCDVSFDAHGRPKWFCLNHERCSGEFRSQGPLAFTHAEVTRADEDLSWLKIKGYSACLKEMDYDISDCTRGGAGTCTRSDLNNWPTHDAHVSIKYQNGSVSVDAVAIDGELRNDVTFDITDPSISCRELEYEGAVVNQIDSELSFKYRLWDDSHGIRGALLAAGWVKFPIVGSPGRNDCCLEQVTNWICALDE